MSRVALGELVRVGTPIAGWMRRIDPVETGPLVGPPGAANAFPVGSTTAAATAAPPVAAMNLRRVKGARPSIGSWSPCIAGLLPFGHSGCGNDDCQGTEGSTARHLTVGDAVEADEPDAEDPLPQPANSRDEPFDVVNPTTTSGPYWTRTSGLTRVKRAL